MTSPPSANNPARLPAMSMGKETPDVFFVLRHYRWLITGGALLGLIVGFGLYYWLHTYAPEFTTEAKFQVQRPTRVVPVDSQADDTGPFVARQALYIKSDFVLRDSLTSERLEEGGRKLQWIRDNMPEPEKVLAKQLEVIPYPGTDLFAIRLT